MGKSLSSKLICGSSKNMLKIEEGWEKRARCRRSSWYRLKDGSNTLVILLDKRGLFTTKFPRRSLVEKHGMPAESYAFFIHEINKVTQDQVSKLLQEEVLARLGESSLLQHQIVSFYRLIDSLLYSFNQAIFSIYDLRVVNLLRVNASTKYPAIAITCLPQMLGSNPPQILEGPNPIFSPSPLLTFEELTQLQLQSQQSLLLDQQQQQQKQKQKQPGGPGYYSDSDSESEYDSEEPGRVF